MAGAVILAREKKVSSLRILGSGRSEIGVGLSLHFRSSVQAEVGIGLGFSLQFSFSGKGQGGAENRFRASTLLGLGSQKAVWLGFRLRSRSGGKGWSSVSNPIQGSGFDCRRCRSNPSGKCSQERLIGYTVTSTMRRAAHPSECARCGAGAGCSAITYKPRVRIEVEVWGLDLEDVRREVSSLGAASED